MAVQGGVGQLIDQDVFEQMSNDELRLTESFEAVVDEYRSRFERADDATIESTVATVTGGEHTAEDVCDRAEYDPDILARFVSILECNDGLTPVQAIVLAVVTAQLEAGMPPGDGAPDGFVPITGTGLKTLVETCERCLVYVWREDCDPCETVGATLEELVDDDQLAEPVPLAVYGPDDSSLLQRNYDVIGAPTVLFTVDGRVEKRLVGSASKNKLSAELESFGQ